MQVTQVNDHVTHAVIGQQKAMEAEIASTAEFFNVLSNTLYSRKEEAVAREVLCNAWDSHIQSGCTDRPIEITLTDTQLTIRDFGTGIKPEDMKVVYLTYGNSTKKHDGSQTGGFGLGSKAPWAYVDHFRVTSYCLGMKTIYALSKSSAEVAGKPSAQPLVSTPTTETGLEVTINIKNHRDMIIFRNLIQRIVSYGEMYAKLNGQIMPALPFSEAKHGYLITDDVPIDGEYIYVRYGNVIYPIPPHNDYAGERRRIESYMHNMGWGNDHWNRSKAHSIVLQSKPNTISVTPSRESLSMTDYTVKALKELMSEFSGFTSKDMRAKVTKLADQALDGLQFADANKVFTTSTDKLMNVKEQRLTYYATSDDLAKRVVTRGMPDYEHFAKRMFIRRLNLLAISGMGNRGMIQSYRDTYRRQYERHHNMKHIGYNQWGYTDSDWFVRQIAAPLVMAMPKEMNGDKLFTYGSMRQNHRKGDPAQTTRQSVFNHRFVQATRVRPSHIETYLPYLRNVVILAYNRLDVDERARHAPEFKFWLGDPKDSLVYITPRTTAKVEIAREFFKSRGMTVVDLTVPLKGETVEAVKPVPKPAVVKPRLKGLPKLNSIVVDDNNVLFSGAKKEDAVRIEAPEFVFYLSLTANGSLNNSCFNDNDKFEPKHLKTIIDLWGDKGGIVANRNQVAKYKAEGAMEFDNYAAEKLTHMINNDTKLRTRIGISHLSTGLEDSYYRDKNIAFLSQLAARDHNFGKQMGFDVNFGDQENLICELIEKVYTDQKYTSAYQDMIKAFKAVPRQTALAVMNSKLKTSPLFKYLDNDQFDMVWSKTSTATEKSGFKDLLIYALEG